MQTRIVVGVDDSDNCLIAVASAAAEAALRGRPLHLLHADGPIMVGIDGSAAGKAVVGFAFAEADRRGCDLVAVHAWSRPVAYDASHTLPLVFDEDAIQAGAERLVSEALTGWHEKHPDVRVRHRLVHGRARRVLTEAANGGQMLVVGTRGRSVLPDVELGSVGPHLLPDAPSPIVAVPQAWAPWPAR